MGFILGDLLLVGVAVVVDIINSLDNIVTRTLIVIVIANVIVIVIISPIFPLPDIEQARSRR